MAANPEQRAEVRRIMKEITKVGFVLPGSLTERRLTCIHGGCHCHDDPLSSTGRTGTGPAR